MLYLDLHCHSVASDDSRATVEQYLKWIQALRNRGHQVDGIVLTEHRKFDASADYGTLAKTYDTIVFKGSEVDTRFGHFLVYGVTDTLLRQIDFSDVHMDPFRLMQLAQETGGIAIPAHPGRAGIGLVQWMSQGVQFPQVRIVERLNAGNRPPEAEAAEGLVQRFRLAGIGGSDAHFVSNIAKCLTRFSGTIRNEAELAEALRSEDCRAVRLEESTGAGPAK